MRLVERGIRYSGKQSPDACSEVLYMSRRLFRASLPTTAALLAGCITVPQSVGEASMFHRDYVGPVGTPRAALMRVSADGVIRVSPGTSCADFSKPETGVALFSTYSMKDYGHLHNRKLGVQGEPPNGLLSTEIALEADKPVVVSYTRTWSTRGTAYTCQMHRTFVPEAGVHYQLQAEPLFSEGICSLAVTRLTEPARLVPASPARLCGA